MFISTLTKSSNQLSQLLLRKMSKIAVCQMTCGNDKEKNFQVFKKLVDEAVIQQAKVVFFPEAVDYIGTNKREAYELAEGLDGLLMSKYREVAKQNKVWLSLGGFHEKIPESPLLHNSHVLIDDSGEISAVYRKLHLFDVSIPQKNLNLKESEYVKGGNELVGPVATPIGNLGLSICYDLRFPEVGVLLRKLGAHILTYPSAFTVSTGEAHWETLLRARAIETQCYVVAAAQYGKHNDKRTSYGCSIIIDPWGKIVAKNKTYLNTDVHADESIIVADINHDVIDKVRKEMPVLEHRRHDVYCLSNGSMKDNSAKDFKFAKIDIPPSTVFYESQHSFAFTNIRCVVPGHVLVCTKRIAVRLEDMNVSEAADFFNTVIRVEKAVEKVYGSHSSTVCIQDGELAGRTIPHVHCHILPRKLNDFVRTDDIYSELAKHDREDNPQQVRSNEEMSAEAAELRKHFQS